MRIELEDNYEDVLIKAATGLGLGKSKVAELAGLTTKQVTSLLKGNFDPLASSKVAISCSGTVTLQLSLLSIPTIVIYKTSFLNAFIGKFFINIDNVILPNFISGKQILPFLFQEKCNTKNIFNLFCEFFDNYKVHKDEFKKLSKDLKKEIIRNKKGFNYNLTKMIFNYLS